MRAYIWAPGTVLRCASCGAVQLRLVQSPERAWLDLGGIQALEIPRPHVTDAADTIQEG
ncbi:MAG TPA: DUF6510 family protein [Acidimicrobiales bacterium]|nr:DUF6510 family protein [Acidimicrobiales bacterium]